jgi:hypothetical protein
MSSGVIMKAISLLLLLMIGSNSYAGAAASLWNGDHINLKGKMLVQDADDRSKFYWMPNKFKLKVNSQFEVDEYGNQIVKQNQAITQEFVTLENGKTYSRYNLMVKLESLSKMKLVKAMGALRRAHGFDARIVGRVPVCGISLGLPKTIGIPSTDASPDNIQIQFGFSEDGMDDCTNLNVPTAFPITIMVPRKLEPSFGKSLVKGISPVLPTVRLAHPYKYEDKASLNIDVSKFHSMVSKGGKVSGTYKFVSGAVEAKVTKAMKQLQFIGSMKLDIQSKDPEIKKHYMNMFSDMLKNYFYSFTASKDGTAQTDRDLSKDEVTFSSGNGQKTAASVKAELAFNKQEAKEIGKISINIEDVNYGAIQSQNTISIPKINKENFSKELRDLL